MITPLEYEKLVLSTIFTYPNGTELIPQKIVFELSPDKFTNKQHQLIYTAVQDLVVKKQIPTVANVASELNSHLEQVGGLSYLQSLASFLPSSGTNTADGYEKWVGKIDDAGRLYSFRNQVLNYAKQLEDFDKAFAEIEQPEEFYQKFLSQFDSKSKISGKGYEDIGVAVDGALRRLDESEEGKPIDIIPCGMPSLEAFHIPRPRSFGVIAGLPSMGKTQLALQIGVGVAIQLYLNKEPGFVFINSLETQKEEVAEIMGCMLAAIDSQKLGDGTLTEAEINRYRTALYFIKNKLPLKINDDADITSSQFVSNAVASHHYYGKRVLGISDYTELFGDKQTETEEQRVAGIAKNVRRVAWYTGSCEILLTQFNNKVHNNSTKVGHMHSSRQSGFFSQGTEWYVEVYNPKQMKISNLPFTLPDGKEEDWAYGLVEKNKRYRPGEFRMGWEPQQRRFLDPLLDMNQLYRDFKFSTMKEEDF